jgi:hypothetical protein
MTTPDDIDLLAKIREVYDELDPVPSQVLDAARGALTWLTVDAELAELTVDSLTETSAVRGNAGARLVTFEAQSLTVEVEVTETGDTRRLVGQLVPPGPAQVSVRTGNSAQTVQADSLGRFTVEGIPAGPVSLLCRQAESREIVTSWITI